MKLRTACLLSLLLTLFCDLGWLWPNRNLELLLAVRDCDLVNPVVSPDGSCIYFLRSEPGESGISGRFGGHRGALWKLHLGDEEPELLLAGSFRAIAVSSDGQRLAACDSALVLLGRRGKAFDTVIQPDTTLGEIFDVEFAHDGAYVFFAANRGVGYRRPCYRVALDGSDLTLVDVGYGSAESDVAGFDLEPDGGIYWGSWYLLGLAGEYWPQFSPVDSLVFVSARPGLRGWDLKLKHTRTEERRDLDAAPRGKAILASPYWYPDGECIVFSARTSGTEGCHELWMLRNVRF
ncbi:MAG: PD40 domain-containing protein [candidate division WOR-3 bacterium]|nr:MAG: PD40 domain-containing protein [candidate division WOR-3 bacterium]